MTVKALAKLAFVATVAVAYAGNALAHHSYAMYEKREMKLEGTVKEFQWTNPHIFLQVLAPDANGQPVEWSFEGGGPGQLARQGWKFNSLKVGDKVTIGYAPLRDGSRAGGLIFVQVKDGTRLGGGPLASLDLDHAPAGSK
jgi:Family of unknown function (DUF6152)